MYHGFKSHTIAAGQQVVVFDADVSTGDAYDVTQTSDEIFDGAVLIVASERVVGVMVEAWPTAVTVEHGAFHTFAEPITTEPHASAIVWARDLAEVFGFELSATPERDERELAILQAEESSTTVAELDDAELEAAIDRRVMRRLATDRRYLAAENAEEQAEAEAAITAEVERELRRPLAGPDYITDDEGRPRTLDGEPLEL
jgi:hypothetical protein